MTSGSPCRAATRSRRRGSAVVLGGDGPTARRRWGHRRGVGRGHGAGRRWRRRECHRRARAQAHAARVVGPGAELSAGRRRRNVRTGPAAVAAVSKRTVTTPRPAPHTQPRPDLGVLDVHARAPRCRRRCAAASTSRAAAPRPRPRSRRTGPPGSSRRARRRPRRAAARRPRCRGRPAAPRASRAMVAALSVGEARVRRAAQRGEVVQPHLDRHRAPRQPVLAQPRRHLARLPGEQALHQPPVGEVGVVGALDADRLGLPLGDHRAGRRRRARGGAGRCRGPGRRRRTSSSRLTASQVGDGVDAGPAQPLGGRRSDAGDDGDAASVAAGRRSVPGGTTTRPSGLSRSLATLAMNLEVPTPTEAVSPPVTSCTRARRSSANAVTVADLEVGQVGAAARSTNASSSESGSTSGEAARSTLHHLPAGLAVGVEASGEERRVRAARARLPRSTSPSGRRTPAPRTTRSRRPRGRPTPPTTTGLPRSEGLSRCSTEAKKASRSRCSTEAVERTTASRSGDGGGTRHGGKLPGHLPSTGARRGTLVHRPPARPARRPAPGRIVVPMTTAPAPRRPPADRPQPRGPPGRRPRRPRLRARTSPS